MEKTESVTPESPVRKIAGSGDAPNPALMRSPSGRLGPVLDFWRSVEQKAKQIPQPRDPHQAVEPTPCIGARRIETGITDVAAQALSRRNSVDSDKRSISTSSFTGDSPTTTSYKNETTLVASPYRMPPLQLAEVSADCADDGALEGIADDLSGRQLASEDSDMDGDMTAPTETETDTQTNEEDHEADSSDPQLSPPQGATPVNASSSNDSLSDYHGRSQHMVEARPASPVLSQMPTQATPSSETAGSSRNADAVYGPQGIAQPALDTPKHSSNTDSKCVEHTPLRVQVATDDEAVGLAIEGGSSRSPHIETAVPISSLSSPPPPPPLSGQPVTASVITSIPTVSRPHTLATSPASNAPEQPKTPDKVRLQEWALAQLTAARKKVSSGAISPVSPARSLADLKMLLSTMSPSAKAERRLVSGGGVSPANRSPEVPSTSPTASPVCVSPANTPLEPTQPIATESRPIGSPPPLSDARGSPSSPLPSSTLQQVQAPVPLNANVNATVLLVSSPHTQPPSEPSRLPEELPVTSFASMVSESNRRTSLPDLKATAALDVPTPVLRGALTPPAPSTRKQPNGVTPPSKSFFANLFDKFRFPTKASTEKTDTQPPTSLLPSLISNGTQGFGGVDLVDAGDDDSGDSSDSDSDENASTFVAPTVASDGGDEEVSVIEIDSFTGSAPKAATSQWAIGAGRLPNGMPTMHRLQTRSLSYSGGLSTVVESSHEHSRDDEDITEDVSRRQMELHDTIRKARGVRSPELSRQLCKSRTFSPTSDHHSKSSVSSPMSFRHNPVHMTVEVSVDFNEPHTADVSSRPSALLLSPAPSPHSSDIRPSPLPSPPAETVRAGEHSESDTQGLLLYEAARKGDLAECAVLLSKGADANYVRGKSPFWTPLMAACMNGHVPVVSALIRRNRQLDRVDESSRTALYLASHQGHGEICRLLLRAGANPNIPNKHGWTPLMAASAQGHIDVVELLLSDPRYQVDCSHKDPSGRTAATLAKQKGRTDILTVLDKAASSTLTVS